MLCPMQRQIVHIHLEAPPKPAWGQPCNGCGVCCLSEPCPLGMLLSRRRNGACVALQWDDAQSCYGCGALEVTGGKGRLARWTRWLVRRWIAAGQGCDCSLEPQLPDQAAL